jgi:peptidyl-prolyl cis-trans isomerase C
MKTIYALLLSAFLCQPAIHARAEDKPVAVVNGVVIPQTEFERALQQAVKQGAKQTPQLRDRVKDQLIARELFVQEARKQNLESDPEVRAIVEEATKNALIQRYLKSAIHPQAPSDEQLRQEYDRVKGALGSNEYKLRVMQLATEERAKEFRLQLQSGKDFAELAQAESLSPSGQRGGELEWVSFKTPASEGQTAGLPLPIAQAAEKLAKGKVSEPISVKDLWWLVKLEDVRPTRVPSFEETKAAIRTTLMNRELERATTELVQRLLKAATITQ